MGIIGGIVHFSEGKVNVVKRNINKLTKVIYMFGSVMTVVAFLISYVQTKTIIKAIKKYSPYN